MPRRSVLRVGPVVTRYRGNVIGRWIARHPVAAQVLLILAAVALVAFLMGCGAAPATGPTAVQAPVATPAPASPFTTALAFGYEQEHRARLVRAGVGQCFALVLDPSFTRSELDLIHAAALAVTAATGDDIVYAPGCSATVRIERDGAHRLVDGTPVTGYAGLAYIDAIDGRVVGGRVIVNPDFVRSKVVMHELLHVVGFMHPGLPGSVMSDLPIDAPQPARVDVDAWDWMRSVPFGAPGPWVSASSTVGRQTLVVVD